MAFRIAIHKDRQAQRNHAEGDRPKPNWNVDIWADVAQMHGHEVVWVDAFSPDILQRLKDCDGFLWRCNHKPARLAVARRLLPVVERHMGLCVFPDSNTFWHYDDKVAQWYLLQASGVPIPETWVFWDRNTAFRFAAAAHYPMVLKLAAGASSRNVRLVNDRAELESWINQAFDTGIVRVGSIAQSGQKRLAPRIRTGLRGLLGQDGFRLGEYEQLHRGYVLLQRYLSDNAFDTRVTVIGNRAFAFRRFNRDADFRASGSGLIDHDPAAIDESFVCLAFETARSIGSQSCAIDGLCGNDGPVVGEISYTYASWAVHECPGHWRLDADDAETDVTMTWHEGEMSPEAAIMEDFLRKLSERQYHGIAAAERL